MGSIRAVLFDLDNTLYENDEELEDWARERAQELIPQEQYGNLIGALPVFLENIARSGSSERTTSGVDDNSALLCRLVPGLSVPAVEFILAMHGNWLANMKLTPDAGRVLSALDEAAIPYGIVTNAPLSQRIKTITLGLEILTQCIFISQEFGADKPDPAIFKAAAESLRMPCDRVLFVGDSPAHDMIGAHNAGMKAAWLRRGRTWPEEMAGQEPDYELASLMEVITIVSRKS